MFVVPVLSSSQHSCIHTLLHIFTRLRWQQSGSSDFSSMMLHLSNFCLLVIFFAITWKLYFHMGTFNVLDLLVRYCAAYLSIVRHRFLSY